MDETGIVLVKLALGATLLVLLVRALRLALSSFEWPKTTGVVGTSEIDEFRGRVRVTGKQLAYIYQVGGKEFISNRIYAPITDNLFAHIIFFNDKKFVQKNYGHGQTVDVFVNPKNPGMACLKQGGSKYVLIEFAIWFIFYVLVVVLW